MPSFHKIAWGSNILSNADSRRDPRDSARCPLEFLNRLTPVELPPHQLYIGKGIFLMLQRNLSPKQGLCNSARLILDKATNIHPYCEIASVDYAREEELIPSIEIKHQGELCIEWNGCQFPVRPSFVMTIKISQDQTQKRLVSG